MWQFVSSLSFIIGIGIVVTRGGRGHTGSKQRGPRHDPVIRRRGHIIVIGVTVGGVGGIVVVLATAADEDETVSSGCVGTGGGRDG